jgi:hypothetical protein
MLASSLHKVFNGRIDEKVAVVWQAVRAMIRGLVDWSSSTLGPDRFELERQFNVLVGALLDGLGRTTEMQSSDSAAHPRRGRPVKAKKPRSRSTVTSN